MGPSGSGKSTMMNLLGGLDTPTDGIYRLEGVNVAELPRTLSPKHGTGRLAQVPLGLLARTTALENVQLPLLYGSMKKARRRARAKQVLAEVGLADRMDHHPSQLSGGQQQRVAIARALVNEPALILADEPTGALDTRTGIEIMAIFQRLNADGMTIVIVTHEEDVAQFAGRIICFQDGRLKSDAPRTNAADLLASLPEDEQAA